MIGVASILLTGCATSKYFFSSYGGGDRAAWYHIDPELSEEPSGTHLYEYLLEVSKSVREIDEEMGRANYVKYSEQRLVEFVYLKEKLYVRTEIFGEDSHIYNLNEISYRGGKYYFGRMDKLSTGDSAKQPKFSPEIITILDNMRRENEEEERRIDQEEKLAEEKRQEDEWNKELKLAEESFDLDALMEKSKSMSEKTFVFKGMYLGMPLKDCLQLLNHHLGYPQVPDTPIKHNEILVGSAWPRLNGSPLRIFDYKDSSVLSCSFGISCSHDAIFPFVMADESGHVTSIVLSRDVLDQLFKTRLVSDDEFVDLFRKSYDLSLFKTKQGEVLTYRGIKIGYQEIHTYTGKRGFEIEYYGRVNTNVRYEGTGLLVPEQSLWISEYEPPENLSPNFN
jgi:hypothetical protein